MWYKLNENTLLNLNQVTNIQIVDKEKVYSIVFYFACRIPQRNVCENVYKLFYERKHRDQEFEVIKKLMENK